MSYTVLNLQDVTEYSDHNERILLTLVPYPHPPDQQARGAPVYLNLKQAREAIQASSAKSWAIAAVRAEDTDGYHTLRECPLVEIEVMWEVKRHENA